jgi:hypothetical protein
MIRLLFDTNVVLDVKEIGNSQATSLISSLLGVFGVAPVNVEVLKEALLSPSSDFEDAATAAAARWTGCGCIVTRDPKGFRGSAVRALTPEAVIPML